MSQRLNDLKLKKARLISEFEMLSHPSDLMYQNFGKVCYDIILEEKEELRKNKNNFQDEEA